MASLTPRNTGKAPGESSVECYRATPPQFPEGANKQPELQIQEDQNRKRKRDMKTQRVRTLMASALVGAGLMLPQSGRSHCDTMSGPVVQAAKVALEKKDVTPVLMWVKPGG